MRVGGLRFCRDFSGERFALRSPCRRVPPRHQDQTVIRKACRSCRVMQTRKMSTVVMLPLSNFVRNSETFSLGCQSLRRSPRYCQLRRQRDFLLLRHQLSLHAASLMHFWLSRRERIPRDRFRRRLNPCRRLKVPRIVVLFQPRRPSSFLARSILMSSARYTRPRARCSHFSVLTRGSFNPDWGRNFWSAVAQLETKSPLDPVLRGVL